MDRGGAGARVTRVRTLARQPDVRRVDVEGVGSFLVSAATAHALGLQDGAELEPSTITRLIEAGARHHARTLALRLLERRLRSRSELERALRQRGVPRATALAVVGDLHQAGWIDDGRFARAWVRDRLALRASGSRRLRAELRVRGVAPAIADEAIATLLPEGAEETLAAAQARARLRRLRGLAPVAARRRLAGWLQRRGYAPDVISRILRAVNFTRPEGFDDPPAV